MPNAVGALLGILTLPAPKRRDLWARFELDLLGFLNSLSLDELRILVAGIGLAAASAAEMRRSLWIWGAGVERAGLSASVADPVQRVPVLRGGRLVSSRRATAVDEGVLPSARAARWPLSDSWPRPIPVARLVNPPAAEPETLDELLARADGLVGVRLGSRGADKGFYGQRIATLLGIARSNAPEPDWRGAVELKSFAVVRLAGGNGWRIKDGPALSMRSVDAHEKLRRVLWVIRVDDGEVPGSPVLSWFYQELDAALGRALERARHLRPKGGAGTTSRGWYLRRDFFVACGVMRSLNGG